MSGPREPRDPAGRPCVLVFAGVDPSGGAGLAADIAAVAGQGAHALTVVTALTAQDNDRVHALWPVEPAQVLAQARALTAAIAVAAVKVGIPGSAANARAIADVIAALRARRPDLPVVLDPVLASGHGDALARGDAVAALAPLLPLATVLTPNGPEARALAARYGAAAAAFSGAGAGAAARAQAQALRALGCRHVLITGGHDDDGHDGGHGGGAAGEVRNRWFGPGAAPAPDPPDPSDPSDPSDPHAPRVWRWPRLAGGFHGSGCTLAAAIAGQLALGAPVGRALDAAQRYCHAALRDAYAIAPGQRIPQRPAHPTTD